METGRWLKGKARVSVKRFDCAISAIEFLVEHSDPNDDLRCFADPLTIRTRLSGSMIAFGWESWWFRNLFSALLQAGRNPSRQLVAPHLPIATSFSSVF